jgi:hypothetical protein
LDFQEYLSFSTFLKQLTSNQRYTIAPNYQQGKDMYSRSSGRKTSRLPGTKNAESIRVGCFDPRYQQQQEVQRTHLLRDQAQDQTDKAPPPGPWATQHDQKMACRQTRFSTLPPEEKVSQEKWAQEKLLLGGECVAGCRFYRFEKDGLAGYMCGNNLCWIPDALLAEGKGGFYELVQPFMVKFEGRRIASGTMPPVTRQSGLRTVWTGPNYRDEWARGRRGVVGNGYHQPGPAGGLQRYPRRRW